MLKNLRISARFALASATLCLLTVVLAGIAYWQIGSPRRQIDEVPTMIDMRLAGDMKASSARNSELQKRIEALPLSDSEKRLFAEMGSALAAYISARERILKLKAERAEGADLSGAVGAFRL